MPLLIPSADSNQQVNMTLCRVCAFESDDFVDIYGSEGEDLYLAQKINDYLPIEVSATDALSLLVCRNCTTFLVAWDDLYTTCKEADHQLKNAYKEACTTMLTNQVEWNNKTLVHDHSYNKNDSDDIIIIPAEVSVSEDTKNEIIIQSNNLINDDGGEIGNIDQANFQVASTEVDPSEIEHPAKKQKIIHFEFINAEGNTFSVSSLELHPDDEEVDSASLEKRGITETVDEIVEDAELDDINENEDLEVKSDLLDEEDDRDDDGDYVEDDDEVKEEELLDEELEEQLDDPGDGDDSADVDPPPRPKKTTSKIEPKVCDICHVVCKGNLAFVKHRKTHPPELRNKCSICSKVSPNDSSHKAHMKTHTDNVHPCNECGKVLSSRSSLSVHKMTHKKERKYQCQICGKTTMTPAKLREHIQIHSDSRPFACSECNQTFKTQQCLKQHAATHNKQPLFVCDICGYSCHRRNHLTKHMASRHSNPDEEKKARMYSCCLCSESFPSRIPLVQHIMEQHPAEEEGSIKAGVLQCKECGKVLTSKAGYHCHMATHSGRRHSCEFCGRTFATSKSLRYHILDHTGEKPFACRICGQRFKGHWLLQRHERVHTGERPYKCSECPMAFRCSMTLYQHKQIHSTVKKYRCAFCPYQTSRAEALRIHLRVHTDERPYPCTICGWAFKQKSDCSKHMALHNRPQGIKRHIRKLPRKKMQLSLALGEEIDESSVMDETNNATEVYIDHLGADGDIKAQNLLTIDDSQLSMPDNTDLLV